MQTLISLSLSLSLSCLPVGASTDPMHRTRLGPAAACKGKMLVTHKIGIKRNAYEKVLPDHRGECELLLVSAEETKRFQVRSTEKKKEKVAYHGQVSGIVAGFLLQGEHKEQDDERWLLRQGRYPNTFLTQTKTNEDKERKRKRRSALSDRQQGKQSQAERNEKGRRRSKEEEAGAGAARRATGTPAGAKQPNTARRSTFLGFLVCLFISSLSHTCRGTAAANQWRA